MKTVRIWARKFILLSLIVMLLLTVGCGESTATEGSETPSGDGDTAAGGDTASGEIGHVGLVGSPERADQEYVWISQFSTLPLFVERVYPGLEAFASDFGVEVRVAGPTTVDLAAYIATVEQECARGPAGIIVVGGWDPALTEPVNKCIEMQVPVVVTDGDLFQSDRLSYAGTDWYYLGVAMAEAQIAEHEARGLETGQVAVISPIQNENMQHSRQGIRDTLAGTGIEVVAEEDNDSDASIAAQRTAALMSAYPDLTGMIGLDSEAGPGIIAALDEAGRTGELVVTVNEAGREFLQNLVDGKAQLITMENYDIMNYLALFMLYTWHNDAIRTAGLDPWVNNWMPQSIDSGLVLVTADTVEDVMQNMEAAEKKAAEEETNLGKSLGVGRIGSPERADQEYVWISQFSTLPLFVERVYPGLEAFASDFGVEVRVAGPTTVDLAAYIATVEQECARGPAGIIVVGGWDPALTEPVNKCIEMQVPVVVTDGDLFQSDRLSYAGTDWYYLGVAMAEAQIAEHEARGLETGQVAVISPIQNENMQHSRQGIRDTLAGTGIEVVAEEDNDSDASIAAQRTAALMSAYPDLTGMIGLDSEAGPGIIAALDEAGRTGELVVTVNEAGREFLQNLVDGKAQLITMENYDIMNYLALFMLYTWHNDAIRTAGLDPWVNNWMPQSIDSGLVLVTADTVEDVMQNMLEAEQLSGE